MTNEEHAAIEAIFNTLNLVSVNGYNNIKNMFGSMNALIKLAQEGTDDGDIHAEQ